MYIHYVYIMIINCVVMATSRVDDYIQSTRAYRTRPNTTKHPTLPGIKPHGKFKYHIICNYNPLQVEYLKIVDFTVSDLPQTLCSEFVYDSYIFRSFNDSVVLPDHEAHFSEQSGFVAFNNTIVHKIIGFLGALQDESDFRNMINDDNQLFSIIDRLGHLARETGAIGVMLLCPEAFLDDAMAQMLVTMAKALDDVMGNVFVDIYGPKNVDHFYTEALSNSAQRTVHSVLSSYPSVQNELEYQMCYAAIGSPKRAQNFDQLPGNYIVKNHEKFGSTSDDVTLIGISIALIRVRSTRKPKFKDDLMDGLHHEISQLTFEEVCDVFGQNFETKFIHDADTNCAYALNEEKSGSYAYAMYHMPSIKLGLSVFMKNYRDMDGLFVQDFLYDDVYGGSNCSKHVAYPILRSMRKTLGEVYYG